MAQLFANNASTTLASNVSSSATTLSVSAGSGSLFPSPTGSNYFLITLIGVTSGVETSWEIIRVTSRSTDTFTIVRAQESTTAAAWTTGAKIELRVTAGSMNNSVTYVPVKNYASAIIQIAVAGGYLSVLNFNGSTTSAPLS
jgi:hypothetical protein